MRKDRPRDPSGIIYKFPYRTCRECDRYPCFYGISTLSCDFAKYGCKEYTDAKSKTVGTTR